MEPTQNNIDQTNQVETDQSNPSWHAPLNRITSTSKVLAAIIFIALPFVGSWIGYQYGKNLVINNYASEVNVNNDRAVHEQLIEETKMEKDDLNGLVSFRDPVFGIEFNFPKAKIDLQQDVNLQKGFLRLISSINNNGVTNYEYYTSEGGEQIPRGYDYKIEPLKDFVFKVVSSGYEYRFDLQQNRFVCVNKMRYEFDACDEVSVKDTQVANTNFGVKIYLFKMGDGGYARKSYVIALLEKGAVISFSTHMDEDSDGWGSGPELDFLIEDVVKSVQ